VNKKIRFKCFIDCSSYCCGGATIITIKEIGRLYKYFPITISFRKIYPFDSFHRNYLENIAFRYKNFHIIGDFIAGNRMRKKCSFLKNSLCSINDIKPLQCRIMPFSVTFPEEYQHLVISQKRKEAFRYCKGFMEDAPVVWEEKFVDKHLKEDFYRLRDYIREQRDILEKIFLTLEGMPPFDKFIAFQKGILEVPIINDFAKDIFSCAGINNIDEFIKFQKSLFIKDAMTDGIKNSLFIEALNMIEKMKDLTEKVKSYYY